MDLRQLQYFVRVAELGSFSKAASFLKVAQPALSRQVRNLEIEHKEALFLRTGRGVQTTEAGERLLSHAKGILRLVERAEEDMEHARTGRAGRVAIGMPVTPSSVIATPLVRRLRTELPDVHATLVHGRSAHLQEQLLAGKLDMALVLDAPNSPMLETHHVATKSLALVGSPDLLRNAPDPMPLRRLATYPMVVPSRPNKLRVTLESEIASIGEQLNVVIESDSMQIGFEMARESLGCAVRFERGPQIDDGLIYRRICEPEINMKIQIILPARRPISKLQDAAFDIFLKVSQEMFG